jgi:nucleotide-binding universal stress UspA family protein
MEAIPYSSAADLTRELFEQSTADLVEFPCSAPKGVRRTVMEGDPARVIADYAASEHCDLVMMPTHGYGPFRRFLLGSVTAKVLHDANCPVCTGPHMEKAPDYAQMQFRQVVCAIDLGPHSKNVLCYAGHFAKALGASLVALHAIPASSTRLGGFYFDPEWGIQLAKAARERIGFLLHDLNLTGVVAVESGDTPVVVRTAAQEAGADLLVIGRGSTHRAHGHLPTNSYAIIREAPCPVIAL